MVSEIGVGSLGGVRYIFVICGFKLRETCSGEERARIHSGERARTR